MEQTLTTCNIALLQMFFVHNLTLQMQAVKNSQLNFPAEVITTKRQKPQNDYSQRHYT